MIALADRLFLGLEIPAFACGTSELRVRCDNALNDAITHKKI